MSKKAKKKSPTRVGTIAPTFYDFIHAVVSDRPQAERMLQANPNWIHEKSSIDETALHDLAVENYVDAARYLLSKGANIDGAQENGTPLTDAAKLGYVEMVALLIEHGADLEARDLAENTPLLNASQNGYAAICDLLLAAGADVFVRDEFDRSVLDVAHSRKEEQIARILSKYS
ncbi:MAG: ankyrin repeat domain-containing protein [Akkermansiaceae bacterium]|nr:ankyrin repeat domain-containing protein [Armatimonadota bacterium]